MVLGVARQQPKNVLEGSATARLFTFRNYNTYFRSLKIQFLGKVFHPEKYPVLKKVLIKNIC